MIRRMTAGQMQVSCHTALQGNYFHLFCVLYDSSSKRQEFLTEKALKLNDFEFTLTDKISVRIQVPRSQAGVPLP